MEYTEHMEQTLINALFRAVELGGETAVEKVELLGALILSNRFSRLTNQEDVMFVESLANAFQTNIEADLKSTTPINKDKHQEMIHAFVSLTKAVEYSKMNMKS